MSIDCVVVDAGARYGLHPTWAELHALVQFHLFEIDHDEAKRLERKYVEYENIKIYPLALYSRDGTLKYFVSAHQGLNSVFTSNNALLRQHDYMLQEFAVAGERIVEARTIDSLFETKPVHFIKLDVEGAEFDVLHGAKQQLQTNLLGIRSEVLFAPIYNGASQFGDLNKLRAGPSF